MSWGLRVRHGQASLVQAPFTLMNLGPGQCHPLDDRRAGRQVCRSAVWRAVGSIGPEQTGFEVGQAKQEHQCRGWYDGYQDDHTKSPLFRHTCTYTDITRQSGRQTGSVLGPVSKSPSVASGVQVVPRKADEGGSLVWLSTEDNAARRRLGAARPGPMPVGGRGFLLRGSPRRFWVGFYGYGSSEGP
jgi:hypothetical protein